MAQVSGKSSGHLAAAPRDPSDLPREFVVDFVMTRNAGRLSRGAVRVNRVIAAFAEHLATVAFEKANQVSTL
jgi:hypothetical protein